ncbi:MAG: proprotein convertase P-domain-containing protein, partial [Oceanospirillum sp.]|nr:proprotein convertase P-domain-containing protein [Oceanospirillum sp.]
PCQSANMDPDNNIPYNMVVAALNAKGMASSYSASGSSVLFSAPGGEYGVNNPAIITTDDINNNSSVNGQNGYTSKFNGTSSATPMVSGVAALILAKNPNLGWRDVRHILISSAKKVDNDIAAAMLIWETGETLTTEPTWQTNSAGYHFHNWYGFGLINAQAAVEAAGNYGSNLPAQQTKYQTSGTLNQAIPDNSNTGTSHILSVSEAEKLTVESVQIRLMLSHLYLSDLQVQLTSPNGMKSVLMTPRNGMGTSISNKEMVLLSQAFYGENSLGDWKLEVFDTNGGDTGTLHSWSMTIYGH